MRNSKTVFGAIAASLALALAVPAWAVNNSYSGETQVNGAQTFLQFAKVVKKTAADGDNIDQQGEHRDVNDGGPNDDKEDGGHDGHDDGGHNGSKGSGHDGHEDGETRNG